MEERSTIASLEKDLLYQVALLQSLAYGRYEGSVSIKELKRHGDVGLGTFHGLNGELILLDGEVYRAAGDGRVEQVSDEETTPFAVASYGKADRRLTIKGVSDYDALIQRLDRLVEERGKNRIYMIRLEGLFSRIRLRSVPKQTPPYGRLVEVLEQQQRVFEYQQLEGTAVGLYCPPYLSQINAEGWHLHFLSKDKTKGGHVLDLALAEGCLTWDAKSTFFLKLPSEKAFDDLDLSLDQSEDIHKVERNG